MSIHSLTAGHYGIIEDPGAVKDVVDTQGTTGDENHFKIRGACIAIEACETDNDVGAQSGSTWEDFSELFTASLVIRGTFLETDTDTKIEVTITFDECPVAATATVTGEPRIGLFSDCLNVLNDQTTDAELSLGQPDASTFSDSNNLKYDCTQAYADDQLRVDGATFVTQAACSQADSRKGGDANCFLLEEDRTAATDQGWVVESSDVYVERWSDASGSLELSSTTHVCECLKDSDCTIENTQIDSLQPFKQIGDIADGEQKPYQTCGVLQGEDTAAKKVVAKAAGDVAVGQQRLQVSIPLLPLSFASADIFILRYEVVLKSALGRRRLRVSKHIKLKAGESYDSSSINGLQVISNGAEAAVALTAETTTEEDEEMDAGVLALIIILASLAVLFAGWMVWRMGCNGGPAGSAAEKAPMMSAVAEAGEMWENLRY